MLFYSLGPPVPFFDSIVLPKDVEFVFVTCWRSIFTVFKDVFGFVRKKQVNTKPPNVEYQEPTKDLHPLSIIIIGIDSLSRLNLIRAMPHTYNYLQKNKWFNLHGYNKVEENTLINLLPVLAGLSIKDSVKALYSHAPNVFDDSPIIWKDFKQAEYVTAYAEDCAEVGTFHNDKSGFSNKPTDYYLRAMSVVAEKSLYYGIDKAEKTCLGRRLYAEYLMDYLIDLVRVFRHTPKFGLFWFNSFSHETTSKPRIMDTKLVEYFDKMQEEGVFNDTIVILMSDHGRRFGYTRFSKSGFLEDRLPALFVSIPQQFKDLHPDFIKNLATNQQRLTSPYDLHLTFKHILHLAQNPGTNFNQTLTACPTCRSLFQSIPENRTCLDAGIGSHWCSCPDPPYQQLQLDDTMVTQAVQVVLDYIKRATDKTCFCSSLTLHKVHSVFKSGQNYLVTLETRPGTGIFEATVRYDALTQTMVYHTGFNRLSRYQIESWCVVWTKDWNLIKVCYCRFLVPERAIPVLLLAFITIALWLIYKKWWTQRTQYQYKKLPIRCRVN